MNRTEAKRIAQIISLEDLKQMFINAQNGIKDWTKTAAVNKGMTKGAAFNILSKGIDDRAKTAADVHILGKINMLREFGEWLPSGYEKPLEPRYEVKPHHQEPNFLDDLF